MAGMIQGIDGTALLNAFRTGREDRLANDASQLKLQQGQLAMQKQQAITGLLRGAGMGGGGVMGNAGGFAPTTPGGPAMGAAPMAGAGGGYGGLNPDMIGQVAVIDPETADKISTVFKNMSDVVLKQHQAKNDTMGAAAAYLAGIKDPAQRPAAFEHAVPALIQAGWTQQELDAARNDLSDTKLGMFQNLARQTDKIIDQALVEKQANQPKIFTPQPGAGAFALDPNGGAVRTLVAPNDGSHPTGSPVGAPPPPKPAIITQRPAGKTDAQLFSEAHEAVRKGANVDEVFRQLQAWGVNP